MALASPVKAASQTIIVPDNYPTIAAALGNASSGDTILVRSGTYLEHSLTIDKTLILIGENASDTIISDIDEASPIFGSSIMAGPTAIWISANNVTISGFTIDNGNPDIGGGGSKTLITGNILPGGITLSAGSYQTITQNYMGPTRIQTPYTLIVNNTVSGSGALVDLEAAGASGCDCVVYMNSLNGTGTDSPVAGSSTGVEAYQSYDNLIAYNNITNCYAGVNLVSGSHNNVTANRIDYGVFGVATTQGGGNNIFNANDISGNDYATALSGLRDTLCNNNFINNDKIIGNPDSIIGPNPSPTTYWSNNSRGNYWSDYQSRYPNAVEVDSSGIEDTPYVIDANNTDSYPLVAAYNVSSEAIQLPEWAMSALTTSVPAASFPPQPQPTSTLVNQTPSPSPTANASSVQQSPDGSQQNQTDKPPALPSPLIILALIIASVALAGTAVSLYLRWRDKKLNNRKERAVIPCTAVGFAVPPWFCSELPYLLWMRLRLLVSTLPLFPSKDA